ncbi:MAG: pyridoxal phosphate-dependent aminotransferase [Candidatus Asgardarchaeum sp.]
MRSLSRNAINIPESGTLKILEISKNMERKGINVIHLDVGEPMFDTPNEIKKAAIDALNKGLTKYTPSKGIYELRKAILDTYNQKYKLSLNPNKNIIITPGAKFSVFSALLSIVSEGDEVVILTPTWVSYWAPIKYIGGKIVEVDVMNENSDYEEKLKSFISKKTKVLIVNTPNNPTGKVLEKHELKIIRDLSEDYDFYILVDEIYSFLTYESEFHSILEFNDILDRVVIIDGFSKKYAMTGWRLGYAIGPQEIINLMNKIQQAATTSPASFVQYAALVVFEYREKINRKINLMKETFKENRDLAVKLLSEIDNISFNIPQGAFYIFPDISRYYKDSKKFTIDLLEKKHVSVTPGVAFGRGGEGHIRISFSASREALTKGISLIKEFLVGGK